MDGDSWNGGGRFILRSQLPCTNLLVQFARLCGWLNAQFLSQNAPAGLILGQGSTAFPIQRQGTHHLAVRFLSPRVQLQLPRGVATRRLQVPVPLVIVRQVAAGVQDMLAQALALYQRPVLKLGTIFQKEVLQELTAIELDHFFQPCSTDRIIFDASAPVFFARMKNRVELGEVKRKVTCAVELNGIS